MTDDRSTPRARGEALWKLQKEGTIASCELCDHVETGGGWELVVRIGDEVTGTRHYDSERIARYYADALRQDYLRDEWNE